MPRQDAPHPSNPGETAQGQTSQNSRRQVSRRALLQGAAGAGAAGLAVTALGVAATPALAATTSKQAADTPSSTPAHADPIVVHVRDARTGDIEVFSGTTQTRLRDRDLAARIARATR
jgi:nitrous oxide reductase